MKKKVVLVLIAAMLVALGFNCKTAYARERSGVGDVNSDERVDVTDAVMVKQHIAGIIDGFVSTDRFAGDANLDGTVDVTDAVMVMQYIAGIIDGFTTIDMPDIDYDKVNVGDYVTFGNYKGHKEWKVLDKVDGKLLLISKYAIEQVKYEPDDYIPGDGYFPTWKESNLRTWLNETFYVDAFSKGEKLMVEDTTNETKQIIQVSKIENTITSTEKVFVLPAKDLSKYFKDSNDTNTTTIDGKGADWYTLGDSYEFTGVRGVFYTEESSDLPTWFGVAEACARPTIWINTK